MFATTLYANQSLINHLKDMTSFRATLSILQQQVDDIDRLKEEHYKVNEDLT
jgi:hypothetical protein